MGKSFDLAKLKIERVGEFRDEWRMAKEPVQGEVVVFNVVDGNLRDDNSWIFYVQIPDQDSGDDNLIVRPETAPSREDLVKVERRAVTFLFADVNPYIGKRYCKVNLADPTGEKTKVGVRYDERDDLPSWMSPFRAQMKDKESVKETRGTDRQALVVFFKSDDYEGMVKLFMATRVWPLLAGFRKGA